MFEFMDIVIHKRSLFFQFDLLHSPLLSYKNDRDPLMFR